MTKPRNKIEPAVIPPAGFAVLVNGQRCDVIGHEQHQRQDGEMTMLVVWHSECLTCGEGFTAKSPAHRWCETRRCEQHRKPAP